MVCSICLDVLTNPFVTPCGHVFCLECLISSLQKSPNAMRAPCPTCRATFSLVTPDPAFIPEKYRPFIDSNIRKVYFDNSVEAALQAQVANLEARVQSLERDKDLLIDRCEAHMAAADAHAQKEKDARVQCSALRKELKQANQCFAELVEKEAHREIASKMTQRNRPPHATLGAAPQIRQKRSLPLAPDHMSATVERDFRPNVPLPKRRRVSRVVVPL